MKKAFLFIPLALALAVVGSTLGRQALVHAQQPERLVTGTLTVTRGQYSVADLFSGPDGVTRLILRDSNGRYGIVLAVSDRPGAERAQIAFYDAAGRLIRTVDASSSDGSVEGRLRRLEGLALPASTGGDGRFAANNTENLWIRVDALDQRIRRLEGR